MTTPTATHFNVSRNGRSGFIPDLISGSTRTVSLRLDAGELAWRRRWCAGGQACQGVWRGCRENAGSLPQRLLIGDRRFARRRYYRTMTVPRAVLQRRRPRRRMLDLKSHDADVGRPVRSRGGCADRHQQQAQDSEQMQETSHAPSVSRSPRIFNSRLWPRRARSTRSGSRAARSEETARRLLRRSTGPARASE